MCRFYYSVVKGLGKSFPLLMLVFFISGLHLMAENSFRGAQIYGKVIDATSNVPLEYVTIAIYNLNDNALVGGTVTNQSGEFKIEKVAIGEYKIVFSFLGYEPFTIPKVEITEANDKIGLGTIKLGAQSTGLEEVEVKGQRDNIRYKLDKKIVDVDKQLTAISGSAVDVLRNVPSINVDIEGNVVLRGSSGFKVLINGVPSVLESSEALQQIPANSIENIEIITNPSAKFSPEGTSGIINVITKKNKLLGFNGVTNALIGNRAVGGDFLLNHKASKFGYYLGADYNYRDYPGDKYGNRTSQISDTTFYLNYDGGINYISENYNFKGGVEFTFDSLDLLNADFSYGYRDRISKSDLLYSEWNSHETDINTYTSMEDGFRGGNSLSSNIVYQHSFIPQKHYIRTTLAYRNRSGDEYSRNSLLDINGDETEGRKNTEKGPSSVLQAKVDYSFENGIYKIEAGYESELSRSEDATSLSINENGSGVYVIDPKYSNNTEYIEDIHSLYAIYGNEKSKLGYQLGLRGEYTKRSIDLISSGAIQDKPTNFSLDKFNIFPSVHVSYELPANNELIASYSRRIHRARSYYLEPFYTWVDAYNIRIGNPDLKPEYIDSYELNYLKKFDKAYFSLETYYRITHDLVEWVRTVYNEDVVERKPYNVGKDYSLGIDGTFSFDIFKWWRADYSGSLYNYKVKGELGDRKYDQNNFTWNTLVNNTFTVKKKTQIQAYWRYYSKRVTSQGYYDPVYTFDLAVKRDFMKRQLTTLLQVTDLFSTNRRQTGSEGLNFSDFYYQAYHTPVVSLNITYRFNNYKPERKRGGRSEGFGDDEYSE